MATVTSYSTFLVPVNLSNCKGIHFLGVASHVKHTLAIHQPMMVGL